MSLPTFPIISPEMTREKALNMILASIAMEELGLSHILNAEGEKIQYVLNDLSSSIGSGASLNDVLAVNRSVESLLDAIMQNQIFLKSKMDRVLNAISSEIGPTGPPGPPGCIGPPGPIGPPGTYSKCIASFSEPCKDNLWKCSTPYPWKCNFIVGNCIVYDTCTCCRILLSPNKYYSISFLINILGSSNARQNLAFSLITSSCSHQKELFTYHKSASTCYMVPFTVSSSNILFSTFGYCEEVCLTIQLLSPNFIKVGQSNLSIIEH